MLYKNRDKLYKAFKHFFKDNIIKISKEENDTNYIKLLINITLPDGDKSNLNLKLYRRGREDNEAFYDTYVSYEKQLLRGKEEEKKKFLERLEKNEFYNLDVGINYDTQIDDGTLKRSYLSKYVNRNFKNKNSKIPGDPDKMYDDPISPTEEQMEEIAEKKIKIGKNGIKIYLLKHF